MKGTPGFLIASLSNSYFRATDVLIQRCPELWEFQCREYSRIEPFLAGFERASKNDIIPILWMYVEEVVTELPHFTTTAEHVLLMESYTQCQYTLKSLMAIRSKRPKTEPLAIRVRRLTAKAMSRRGGSEEDGAPEWKRYPLTPSEYHCLLIGNILRNRPDRLDLWSVIEAQVRNGHSKATKYLKLALRCSNMTALRAMLDIGWNPGGSFLSQWFLSPALLALRLEMKARKPDVDIILAPALLQDQDFGDAPPLLRGPALETHKGLYSRYNRNRSDRFRSLYIERLRDSQEMLKSYGAPTSIFPLMLAWAGGSASWQRDAYVDVAMIYIWLAYAVLYAAILPLSLTFGTKMVWTSLPLSSKLGFTYLWSGLAAGMTLYTIRVRPPRYQQKFRTASVFIAVILFIANHFVLPVLVIRFHLRPFLSCTYYLEDVRLASTCVDYSYLLPLVVGVVEVGFWSTFKIASGRTW